MSDRFGMSCMWPQEVPMNGFTLSLVLLVPLMACWPSSQRKSWERFLCALVFAGCFVAMNLVWYGLKECSRGVPFAYLRNWGEEVDWFALTANVLVGAGMTFLV